MSGRVYSVVGPGSDKAPDYERVARALTDADLEEEILSKRGEAAYQAALVAELDRRSKEGGPA
jgi:hypothetical protein